MTSEQGKNAFETGPKWLEANLKSQSKIDAENIQKSSYPLRAEAWPDPAAKKSKSQVVKACQLEAQAAFWMSNTPRANIIIQGILPVNLAYVLISLNEIWEH